ncbi:MAG: LPS export ABC transporter periplasmic protein LptC [Gammaproteobacteria bacterium]|nr:LPS export ABC transporter periplasmic protein LptC [Gammaproteobacteria bacterium]
MIHHETTWTLNKLALTAILFMLGALSWWLPNTLVQPGLVFERQVRHDPDYYAENVNAVAMDENGEKKYTLVTRRLTHYPDDQTVYFEQPDLTQYKPGAAPVHTWADRGRSAADGKQLIMTGNVKVVRGPNKDAAPVEISTRELTVVLE